MRSVPGLMGRAGTTLTRADRLLEESRGLPAELEEVLRQGDSTLRSLRALADLAERNPQAFLRGKTPAE
jgi:hypothetical protein